MGKSSQTLGNKDKKKPNFWQKEKKLPNIGTKSMQNTSAYEELRSSGKRLHKYSVVSINLYQYTKKLSFFMLLPHPNIFNTKVVNQFV